MSALDAHKTLHEILPNEEVVTLASGKGDEGKFKLNHEHKTVLVAGGPDEDCAWRNSNASYADMLSKLGRNADNSQVPVAPVEPAIFDPMAPEA
jgi:hypothetical protein